MGLDDAEGIRAHALQVEALGYDELFTSDHLGLLDPFVPLVVAPEATTTLRLGPLVLNNEFHNPVLLARTAASVDRLSGGRLVLGLGTGYAQGEHDAIGLPLRPRGDRVTRLDESASALRALLDGGTVEVDGDQISLAVHDLGVRPAQQRVPLLIGGHGRRVIGVAGRHADIFQFMGMTHTADGALRPTGFAIDDLVERHHWLAAAAGARSDDIERSALVQRVAVGSAGDAVRAELADRFGFGPDLIDDCPFLLVGSVEQLVDRLERLRELLGISHYVVRDAERFAPVVDRLRGR